MLTWLINYPIINSPELYHFQYTSLKNTKEVYLVIPLLQCFVFVKCYTLRILVNVFLSHVFRNVLYVEFLINYKIKTIISVMSGNHNKTLKETV